MPLESYLHALANGAAYIEFLERTPERQRLIIDVPTGAEAVLVQDYTFGARGNVRTMEHVWKHFRPTLWNNTTHHASNGEWQRYAPGGVSITDTELLLTASIIDPTLGVANGNIQSGLIRSKWAGHYGYWEARMKLVRGQGYWPAFWLLNGGGGWDAEIDVMENWDGPSEGLHTYHVNAISAGSKALGVVRESKLADKWRNYKVAPKDDTANHLDADYHTYGCEWTPYRVRFFFDDVLVYEREYKWLDKSNKLAAPAELIVNLAVGSNSQGGPDETTPFPASVGVKYVRVWDKRPTPRRVAELADATR